MDYSKDYYSNWGEDCVDDCAEESSLLVSFGISNNANNLEAIGFDGGCRGGVVEELDLAWERSPGHEANKEYHPR